MWQTVAEVVVDSDAHAPACTGKSSPNAWIRYILACCLNIPLSTPVRVVGWHQPWIQSVSHPVCARRWCPVSAAPFGCTFRLPPWCFFAEQDTCFREGTCEALPLVERYLSSLRERRDVLRWDRSSVWDRYSELTWFARHDYGMTRYYFLAASGVAILC